MERSKYCILACSHRNDINRWKKMDKQTWKDEMVGIRKMIAQFANIPPCEIIGNRAPYLQGGGDAMFEMLYENNFKWVLQTSFEILFSYFAGTIAHGRPASLVTPMQ